MLHRKIFNCKLFHLFKRNLISSSILSIRSLPFFPAISSVCLLMDCTLKWIEGWNGKTVNEVVKRILCFSPLNWTESIFASIMNILGSICLFSYPLSLFWPILEFMEKVNMNRISCKEKPSHHRAALHESFEMTLMTFSANSKVSLP